MQVKNTAGKWISADPIPGTFVCNIGDMLRIWSNGLYNPTAHRFCALCNPAQLANSYNAWSDMHMTAGILDNAIAGLLCHVLKQDVLCRVINADPKASRVSVPFFYEPAFEAVVAPLPQLCTPSRPPCALPMRYGTHLESKVLNNFELDAAEAAVAS